MTLVSVSLMKTRGRGCRKIRKAASKDKTSDACSEVRTFLVIRHYADDVVEYFVQKSIANGIDIIRIFDALKRC